MTTEISKVTETKPAFLKNHTDSIQKVSSALSQLKTIGENVDDFENSLLIGYYLNELRENLNDNVIKVMRSLQNTSIGFKTDRKDGYDEYTIKNCIIEAYMYGLRPLNNEFNILGGNFYVTKNGLDRLVHSKAGLEKIEIVQKGIVQSPETKKWKVKYSYSFKIKGLEEVKGEQDIIVNGTVGAKNYEIPIDAIQGKSYRKILHHIYTKMNIGLQIPEGEVGDDSISTQNTQSQVSGNEKSTAESKLENLLGTKSTETIKA